jgi:hypothetical protein
LIRKESQDRKLKNFPLTSIFLHNLIHDHVLDVLGLIKLFGHELIDQNDIDIEIIQVNEKHIISSDQM